MCNDSDTEIDRVFRELQEARAEFYECARKWVELGEADPEWDGSDELVQKAIRLQYLKQQQASLDSISTFSDEV